MIKPLAVRIALLAAFAALAVVPVASAGKPGAGGKTCTQKTPGVQIDNNWAWSQWGSYGLPGQQLTYEIQVINYDQGCPASTFVATLSAPNGFAVSFPTTSISLKSGTSGYLMASITSPAQIPDDDYPVTVTVQRAGSSGSSASFTSYYKVYSSDSTAPTVYWPNPGDGQTLTGSSYNFTASSSDDHSVQRMELYIDGALVSSTTCGNVAYSCQIYTSRSLSGLQGPHTATFKAYDWLENVGSVTVSFAVA